MPVRDENGHILRDERVELDRNILFLSPSNPQL